MQIGAQLFTIRNFIKTHDDIEASFKKIADIGYKNVQVSGIGEIAPESLKEIADKNDIKIIITHTNPDLILNDTDTVIRNHKIYGCNHVGIGSMPAKYERTLEGFRIFISEYTEAAKKLNAQGMKLHYHNHSFEFEKFNGDIAFDVLVNETEPALWGFILDTYWVQHAGRNPAKQIEDLCGRIDVCHFKDMQIKDKTQLMAPVMEGNLCFDEIIKACKKTNIQYAMVEQDNCYEEDPFDMLKLSLNNLQKVGF